MTATNRAPYAYVYMTMNDSQLKAIVSASDRLLCVCVCVRACVHVCACVCVSARSVTLCINYLMTFSSCMLWCG